MSVTTGLPLLKTLIFNIFLTSQDKVKFLKMFNSKQVLKCRNSLPFYMTRWVYKICNEHLYLKPVTIHSYCWIKIMYWSNVTQIYQCTKWLTKSPKPTKHEPRMKQNDSTINLTKNPVSCQTTQVMVQISRRRKR